MLIVTHNKQLVNDIGGRVIELEKGSILYDSKPKETIDDTIVSDSSVYDKLVEEAQSETDNDITTEDVGDYDELVERIKKEMQ